MRQTWCVGVTGLRQLKHSMTKSNHGTMQQTYRIAQYNLNHLNCDCENPHSTSIPVSLPFHDVKVIPNPSFSAELWIRCLRLYLNSFARYGSAVKIRKNSTQIEDRISKRKKKEVRPAPAREHHSEPRPFH